jgi:hypothetical protein
VYDGNIMHKAGCREMAGHNVSEGIEPRNIVVVAGRTLICEVDSNIFAVLVRHLCRTGVVVHGRSLNGIIRNLGDPAFSTICGKGMQVRSGVCLDGVSGVGAVHSSGVAG